MDPVVYRLRGELRYFGQQVAVVGDADGDSAPDFAVGMLGPRRQDMHPGRVDLFSGRSGRLLRSWSGTDEVQNFGYAGLWAFPDLDGDGVLELGVLTNLGVHVLSPKTGELWYFLPVEDPVRDPGHELVLLPDIDGDGVGEFVFGSYQAILPPLSGAGRVRCYSGRTGQVLWTRWGTRYEGWLCGDLCLGGDGDGDGTPDILCSEKIPDDKSIVLGEWRKEIHLLSARSGATLRTYSPPGPRHFGFGYEIINLGDRDADGYPEIAVSAPFYREEIEVGPPWIDVGDGRDLGSVGVYRLPDFELLFSVKGRQDRNSRPNRNCLWRSCRGVRAAFERWLGGSGAWAWPPPCQGRALE
ncbi:MAG: hypothetical protein HY721_25645, partial [Planctomycetes bacterium]|nr:hypothetical protein [Planctomycetota bacterium]